MTYLSDFIFHIRSSITQKTHLMDKQTLLRYGLSRPRGFYPQPLLEPDVMASKAASNRSKDRVT
jgi:hypothetical protein